MPKNSKSIALHLACLCISLVGVISSACAQDLGTHGYTYIPKEMDGVELLKNTAREKLNKEGQQNLINAAQKRTIAFLSNLPPLSEIEPVSKNQVRFEDLSVIINKDIKDTNGKVIAAAGTKINPLEKVPLTKKVYFIDARDAKQLEFTKQNSTTSDVVILTAGNLFEAQKYLNRPLFIDHNPNGVIARRMHIRAAPSVASQSGLKLKIEEIKL